MTSDLDMGIEGMQLIFRCLQATAGLELTPSGSLSLVFNTRALPLSRGSSQWGWTTVAEVWTVNTRVRNLSQGDFGLYVYY